MFREAFFHSRSLRRRSSLYLRSEIMYLLPAVKSLDTRRHCILEALERSLNDSGCSKQFSGFGRRSVSNSRGMRVDDILPHIHAAYLNSDREFAEYLLNAKEDSFPMKRLYNLAQMYSSVWSKLGRGRSLSRESLHDDATSRGPFPYVEERATVLSELTKSNIQQTRNRVNSESHPKWALRAIRRRRRRQLIKAKRRSISQESTRELQARLIANKAPKSP